MGQYILRRLIAAIPVLFGITIISFAVIHLAPGKPTDLTTQLNPKVSYQARERLEELYGRSNAVAVIFNDRNTGFSRAVNQAAEALIWLGAGLRSGAGSPFILVER